MKRIAGLLLAAALCAGCAAAPQSTAADSSAASALSAPTAQANQPDQTVAEAPTAPPSAAGNVLTGEAEAFAGQRPAAVVISNAAGAVRQWGIADAQVMMEALTEGKSTNLCLWYSTLAGVPKVGPVAQGKDLFWQFALGVNAVPVQKGANRYAANLLNCYALQPVDALAAGVNAFDYDGGYGIADEFCWYTNGPADLAVLNSYGVSEQGQSAPLLPFGTTGMPNGLAQGISIQFSATAATLFGYDAANGVYQMFHADSSPYLDATSGAVPAFRNVLVLYSTPSVKDDGYTREYELSGGEGVYLTAGTWEAVQWKKGGVGDTLSLYAADGTPVGMNTGRSYIAVVGGFAGQHVSLWDSAGVTTENPGVLGVAQPTTAPTAAPTATPAPTPEPTPELTLAPVDPNAVPVDPNAAPVDPNAAPVDPNAVTPDPNTVVITDPAAMPTA